jgi:hypothetical protein
LDLFAFLGVSVAKDENRTCKLLETRAASESENGSVGQGSVGSELVAKLNGDAVAESLASLDILDKTELVGQSGSARSTEAAASKELARKRALDFSGLDGHPEELRLSTVEGEGNNAHHVGTGRVAGGFEGATQEFVNLPIGLLADGTAVVNVLATAAELAWLGTNGALLVCGCHLDVGCCDVIVVMAVMAVMVVCCSKGDDLMLVSWGKISYQIFAVRMSVGVMEGELTGFDAERKINGLRCRRRMSGSSRV